MKRRKRWPARNTDELVRYVARQLPELTYRQVLAAVNVTMQAVRDSLGEQAEAGVQNPSVTVQQVGVFELRLYKKVVRKHLDGQLHETPPRWHMMFRPSRRWSEVIATWRTSPEVEPSQTDPEVDDRD
jgi:nucleoid DNA-binding protein